MWCGLCYCTNFVKHIGQHVVLIVLYKYIEIDIESGQNIILIPQSCFKGTIHKKNKMFYHHVIFKNVGNQKV